MLTSDTVHLREVRDSDIPKMCKLKNDPIFYPFFYEMLPITLELQKKWVEKVTNDSSQILFIVADNQTDEFIGFCSLYDIDRRNAKAEYGRLLVDPKFKGKGIGKQIEGMILEYAFNHLNLHKVYAEVFSNNKNVIEMHIRNGFKIAGEYKEHIYKNGVWEDVTYLEKIK